MLLDTSGLFALDRQSEPLHRLAVQSYRAARHRLTHNYVLSEFVALATTRRVPRQPAVTFVQDLLTHPRITVIWVDEALHREAIQLLVAQRDKTYSLADAVSFVLMKRHNIHDALTTDHHFEQAGFNKVLK